MAEIPVNPLDEPTEQSVRQTLLAIPTWKEWLEQHGFRYGRGDWGLTEHQWYRVWKDKGRGWLINVTPDKHTIAVNVYNTLLRGGRSCFFFNVKENTVPKLVEQLIQMIEKPVSDRTRKKHIMTLRAATHYELRDDPGDMPPDELAMTPAQQAQVDELRHLGLIRYEAVGPLKAPIPDDPNDLTKEQLDRVLSRVRVRCFQPGQRVKVRTERQTRLNGQMGTVVDAGPHSCYVALDDYVQAGDDDPFRFEEQELEPVFESVEPDMDAPKPYMAAMDYISPLKDLGYHNSTSRGDTLFGKVKGRLKGALYVTVEPSEDTPAATVYVDYNSDGELQRIQHITVPAIEVLDVVRDIDQLANTVNGISAFADALRERNYPGTAVADHAHLQYMFGEAVMEAVDDPDDPERYIQDLQHHYDVINAFREQGVRMRRRMSADRPYYEMFWIPNAVTDVTYDVYIQPEGAGGWMIWAKGEKKFEHPRWGETQEPFDIEDQWTIETTNMDEVWDAIANILYALKAYKGPDELSPELAQELDDLNVDEALRERILYPAVYLAGHVYIGSSHVAIMTWLGQQGLLPKEAVDPDQEPHHGWWTSAPRYLDSDLDINDLMRIDRRFAQRTGEEPGVKGEELPLARKIGTEVRMVEGIDADDINYRDYSVASANWNPVMMLTSKEVRRMIRSAGYKVNGCYKSRITHGWVTTSEPGTSEVFQLMRANSYAEAERLKDHLRTELIKRFPTLSGQTPQGINMDVFDKKIQLSAWQWSGETSADPANSHNYVMYADIQPADYRSRRRGGEMAVAEALDPDEIKDVAGYVKGVTDPVKVLEEFGYVYSDQYGHKRWNKYWDLPEPLQTKREWWTPTFTRIWGSPDIHGQYVYGLIDPKAPNAKSTGYIIVQPLNRVVGKDDWDIVTSVRRMLLQIDNLFRQIPTGTTDPDVMRNWLAVEMDKIKDAVNKEASATWQESLDVDDPEYYVRTQSVRHCPKCHADLTQPNAVIEQWVTRGGVDEVNLRGHFGNTPESKWALVWDRNPDRSLASYERGLRLCAQCSSEGKHTRLEALEVSDPDDPEAMIARTRTAQMGEVVDVTCPHCGDKRQLFKNWPDNMPEWGSKCAKCGGFISLPTLTLDAPETAMAHAQTCPRCQSANARQTGGEAGREYWTCGDCGDKFMWSPDRAVRLEAEEPEIDAAQYTKDTLYPEKIMGELGYVWDSTSAFPSWSKLVAERTQFRVWFEKDFEWSLQVYEPHDDIHWNLVATSTMQKLGMLKAKLTEWEKRYHEGTLIDQKSGIVNEGVDDPADVLATHRPFVYSLYGQYANYDGSVNFRVFPNLTEAVEEARSKNLRDEYDYVWVEEYEADDLSGWETGETFAVNYTGIKYEVTSDYNVIKHVNQQPSSMPPNRPVREGMDDDIDPEHYANTTFDPVQFLRGNGWEPDPKKTACFYKDFSLPHDYYLGGMEFDHLMVEIELMPAQRSAFAAFLNVRWMTKEGYGLPVKGWNLDHQLVTPGEDEYDSTMPIRRFALEIGNVLGRIAWPENDSAALHANSKLEAEVSRFVRLLNDKAKEPLHDKPPVEEAAEPDPDDPTMVLKSHPGFHFKHTQYMGDMVFPVGPGEDMSDWPQDIGRVVQGPDNRWYVIGVRDVPDERLPELGFGFQDDTFDSAEDAALAIWLVRSRMPEKVGVLGRRRKSPRWVPEARSAYAGFNADELNSGQPMPKDKAVVYKTLHSPWAAHYAQRMRDKYGINVWLDGTVTTGWKIIVHASDADRAKRMFASTLGEAVSVDDPDLSHWGERLSIENRLEKLYGRGHSYMKDDPEAATKWCQWFRFGYYEVWCEFTMFYKVENAPSGSLYYQIKFSNWEHHNSEFVHGQYNILKMIELFEKALEELKTTPPQKVSDVVRAFEGPLTFAYNKERYGTDT